MSHPQSSNPFPGAYLNARVKLTLEKVSLIHQTLLKLEVTFLTDFQNSVGTCSLMPSLCSAPEATNVLAQSADNPDFIMGITLHVVKFGISARFASSLT